MAWMNSEALELSLRENRAIYYSRSRQSLWRKGEDSGNVQKLKELRVDCDGDTVLIKVEQVGGIACHTGRRNCFYRLADANGELTVTDDVLRDPGDMYGKNS
jgi:phosphoribosyl-AMP cyclohydrolase